MNIYKHFFRPFLFRVDPEKAHNLTFLLLRMLFFIPGVSSIVKKIYALSNPALKRNVFGIEFPNAVGLAAGLDKNAEYIDVLSCFGFGFIEVGTVTPLAQEGNEKPRMFRLPADQALINRMGFNNKGLTEMVSKLKRRKKGIIVGGNIGKNKITLNENAIGDYETCFTALYLHVDYFAVNVSSPNTPGLRTLQEKGPLLDLLLHLQKLNAELSIKNNIKRKPVLLKIAPDLSDQQLDEIIEVILKTKLDGVIATNTTLSRENLISDKKEIEEAGPGGLSGIPLSKRSTEIIRYLSTHSGKQFHIIGVGGIHSAKDALEKMEAGADLIQLYTGFIYEGPGLIRSINKKLLENARKKD